MRAFEGKTAFITGGAGGIGGGIARRLAEAGAQVMLADVEAAALDAAVERLSGIGPKVEGVLCDVSDPASVEDAAQTTFATFGSVHVLVNNAGVSRAGLVERIAEQDWQWVVSTNLMGVVHGLQAFLPHLKEHGEEAHILNTASIAGVVGGALSGPYAATKHAIVGLSHVLAAELEGSRIGVSVLCPSWVRTNMPENGRNRPERFGGPFDLASDVDNAERNARYLAFAAQGLDPDEVGSMVLDAIRENRFYIFTHPDQRAAVEGRIASILEGFDAADRWSAR